MSGSSSTPERLLREASRPECAEEREGGDVARDHERERRGDAPEAPPRQVRAGDEPGQRDAEHDRRRGHAGDEQPGRDDELEGPLAPEDLPRLPRAERAYREIRERELQQRDDDARRDDEREGRALARPACSRRVSGLVQQLERPSRALRRAPCTRCPARRATRSAAGPPSRVSRPRAGTRPPRPRSV